MIRKVAIITSFLVVCYSYAQKATVAQVDSIYDIGFSLRNGPKDSTFALINKSKVMSEQIGYQFGERRADIFLIFFYTSKGQFDTASTYEKTVFDFFSKNDEYKNSFQHGLALYYSGVLKWRSQRLSEAQVSYNSALEIFTELDDAYYIGSTLSRLGIIQMNQSNYPEALDLFMKSYLLKLDKGRAPGEYAPELANIAAVYYGMGSDEEATRYAKLSLDLELQRGNHLNVARMLLQLGSAIDDHDPDSAIYYFDRAFEIASKNGYRKTAGIAKYRVALTLTELKKYVQSQNELIQLTRELNVSVYKDLSSDIFQLSAVNDFNLEDFRSAIVNARSSLAISESYGAKKKVVSSAQLLSTLFGKVSSLDSALYYTKLYSTYRDSIHSNKNQMKIAQLNSKLDNLKIQREVQLLEKQSEIDRQNQRLLVISLIAIILIAALIVMVLIFRHKSNQRRQLLKTLELEKQKSILDEELHQQTLHMIHMNNGIEELQESLSQIKEQAIISSGDVQKVLGNIKFNKTVEKEWENFDTFFGNKHKHFYENLILKHPELSIQNRRLAALIRIDLSNLEIAKILNINKGSAKMGRYRLKSKLGLQEGDNLTEYLIGF